MPLIENLRGFEVECAGPMAGVMWLNRLRTRVVYGICVSTLIALAGCIQRFHHQPVMAARKAQQFADVAFVKRYLDAAYPLLSQSTRASITIGQFKDVVSKMHPSEYPLFVQATDYEPLMGQKAMNIYLTGEAESGRLYYRFVMEGTQETDYMVSGFWRNDGPYPATNLRKPL